MAKEKDFETIEGGDHASDEDMGQEFEGKEEEEVEDVVDKPEVDAKPRKVEELRFKDGDDDWDKDKEGEVEEKEEEVKKEGEVEGEKEGEKELSEEEKKDKKSQEDVIKYLDETPEGEGGGTKYRIKGKDYDLRDLTPQEFKQRFSLAGRAYERMEEVAHKEKDLTRRERLAEEGAIKSQEIMRRYGEESPGKGEETSLPDILKPDDEDTDLEKSLKEMNANLYKRVGSLESGMQRQDFEAKGQNLHRQLDSLQEEFPMMSKSEVIAVVSMPEYADVDIRVVAENSHNERMGDTYLDSVFKVRPDKLREIEERAIEKHLTGKPNVRKISRKSSSTVASEKVSSGKKRPPRTFDEIEAREGEMRRGYDESLQEVD